MVAARRRDENAGKFINVSVKLVLVIGRVITAFA
jgi:hypothetical protein